MANGKEAFESAAEIGVSNSYNNRQFSQIFKGIRESISDAAAEAGRDPIVDDGNAGATPPTEYPDPDYPELEAGDIWIDENGGLNFYYNDQWNQVKVYTKNVLPNDDSPLRFILTPNGERFYNQKEYNEWLYTRTDRRPIVTDQGAPTIHPDFPAYPLREGDYWIDENHHLYYWNKDSNAWIPVDAGGGRLPIFAPDEPVLHPDYNAPDDELQVGDHWYDTDDGFKQYIYDGVEWIALTPDRHEAFTRIYEAVDSSTYNSGNIGTCALIGDGALNGITNIKVAGTDLQNKIRLAFDENDRIVIEDDRDGSYAVYRITNIDALGEYTVLLITNNGTPNIELGETYSFVKLNDGDYVRRSGDTMTGDLEMDDASIKLNAGSIIFQPIDEQANAGVDGPARFVNLVSKRVRDEDGILVGGSKDFGIRVDLTEGRTGYNKFEFFANVDGQSTGSKFADFGGGNNPTFRFKRGSFQMEGNRIQKLGNAQVDTDALPYGQFISELQDFRDDLIQNLTFGTWRYNSQATLPATGRFFARNDAGANSGISPQSVTQITCHEDDLTGAKGAWDRVDVGELLTMTSSDGLQVRYKVNSAAAVSGPSNEIRTIEVVYISKTGTFNFIDTIDWSFVLTEFEDISIDEMDDTYLRLDCSNQPLITNSGLVVKPEDYGEGSINLVGKRDNKNNSTATIRFKNSLYDDSDTVNGYITYRTVGDANGYFSFNKNIDIKTHDVYNITNLKLTNPGSIWSDTNERIKFKTSTSGATGQGLVEFTRPGSNARRGFVIRGNNTSNVEDDLLFSYTYSSNGDSIDYVGRQDANSNNLATTKYVKTFVEGKGYASGSHNHNSDYVKGNYTISKSNGNFYIQ